MIQQQKLRRAGGNGDRSIGKRRILLARHLRSNDRKSSVGNRRSRYTYIRATTQRALVYYMCVLYDVYRRVHANIAYFVFLSARMSRARSAVIEIDESPAAIVGARSGPSESDP